MQIDNKKVNLFYDLIDKACMVYYNDIKIYVLFGLILAWVIFYICFFIKESGWFNKIKK